MLDVSIIIVNYGAEELITDCVASIIGMTEGVSYEIIIVDNASPNNSFRLLEEKYRDDGRIRCLRLKENVGFGRANNAGFELSEGRNIFCLNPDTELRNNAVCVLSKYLDDTPDAGACGGNLFHKDGQMCTSYRMLFPSVAWEFSFMTNYLFEKMRYGKNRKFNTGSRIIDVATITGADLMIRRSVIEDIGFFDPHFFMYYEDTDLCYRIRKKKFQIKNIPQAQIYHYEGTSTKNLDKKAKFNFEGRELFYHKHYSRAYRLMADIVYGWAIVFRILALTHKKESNKVYWTTLLRLLRGKYFS